MAITAFRKKLQTDNDPEGKKLIKTVLDIINAAENQQPKNQTDSRHTQNKRDHTSKIILHIDDDEDDRELLSEAINTIDSSFTLHEAKNGPEGIAYLANAKTSGILPSLIILDVNMPGMDGLEAYDQIRKDDALKAIPTVIFTTSEVFRAPQDLESVNLPVFIKPFNNREFIEVIKKMLLHCKD